MSKPKKNLEKARQIKGLGNSGLKKIFLFFITMKISWSSMNIFLLNVTFSPLPTNQSLNIFLTSSILITCLSFLKPVNMIIYLKYETVILSLDCSFILRVISSKWLCSQLCPRTSITTSYFTSGGNMLFRSLYWDITLLCFK